MWSWKAWRRRRILRRHGLPAAVWQNAFQAVPLLQGLEPQERRTLVELATLLLYEKAVEPVDGLSLDDAMRARLALQACLPILNLGMEWYEGWVSIVVYSEEFAPGHEVMDEAGVMHTVDGWFSGESWERGPVIIAWRDVAEAGWVDGYNVVIHEFAHKLDMLNGVANGLPPLHKGMSVAEWSRVFNTAFHDLSALADRGADTALDPYGAESPAEFFAVASEAFFETPRVLQRAYPEVYHQLKSFYRQDPLSRAVAGQRPL